ncbi:MAG: histidine phosphatase family protein [Thermaurantiacus sp.]
MSERLDLILVRHGLPAVSADLAGDPPLSDTGRAQASATCAMLAGERIDRIVSSTLVRAIETARPLAEQTAMPLAQIAELGEIDRLTGRYASIESVRARGREEWKTFLADPLGYFGVDADRYRAETIEGFRLASASGGRIAIFTHGFPINLLLSHALGIPDQARFVPSYGSITRLSGRSVDHLTVVSINETAHLPADLLIAMPTG